MRVSIVIRSYNEERHIERLLQGILAQRGVPTPEIILVDSGSTDSTVEIAERYGVRVVGIESGSFTFGGALNTGVRRASGEFIVFASAHVYPRYDNWLAHLVAPFADASVVLSYGKQRGDTVNKFSEHQIFAKWYPERAASPQKSHFCNNANCAIRKSAWETNPYDETLTGLEDVAWAKKAQERGGWIAYVADAEVIHVHDETWEQVQNRYRREALALKRIDPHTHFSRVDFIKLLVANVVADLRAARRAGVLRHEFGSILRFRYHQMLGTYRGHNDSPEVTAEMRRRFYFPMTAGERGAGESDRAIHSIDYDALREEWRARHADAEQPNPVVRPIKKVK